MANVTLVALSAVSGVPLFIRHKGSNKPPSYNVVGSLNGVFMFGESQGTKLIDTRTPHMAITWKTYHDSVRLILLHGDDTSNNRRKNATNVNNDSSSKQSCLLYGGLADQRLLDLIFNSLVLLLSIDALASTSNIERLKKDVKVCYPLLDVLLERCEGRGGGRWGPGPLFSHLVHCSDTVLPPDNYNLQSEVQKWSEGYCSSSYGCLVSANGRVLAGSRTYWTLSSTELVLLPMLLLAAPTPNTATDVAVYLPHKSPKVPFRLLGIKLTCHVWCVSVCGPSPSLASVLKSAVLFWGPYYAGIETLAATQPYNMTAGVRQSLDKAVLGLLLINYETKRCISCVHLGPSSKSSSKTPNNNNKHSSSSSGIASSNTNTIKSTATRTSSGITDTIERNTYNNSNTGTVDSRSRKAKGVKSQSPPRSQCSTLKSSSGKTPTIHTYQTVELNISPVQPRRALSPHGKNTSRALSPSSGSRALSPSSSRPTSRVSRTVSPAPDTNKSSNKSASHNRALSPSSSKPNSNRTLSPTGFKSNTSRALSPSGAGPGSVNSRNSRALSPSAGRSCSPHSTHTNTLKSNKSSPGGGAGAGGAAQLTPAFKMAALASVYRSLVGGLLQPPGLPVFTDTPSFHIEGGHSVTEAYVWCGVCRVYVLQTASLHLLVVLPSALPHTLARSVTYKTLDVFLKGKTPRL
uniref:Protein fuzzy homolog n=2 Tax=Hirondellea gigas TaxID=1518452 RepID=A0A6A7FYV5_9CRUS